MSGYFYLDVSVFFESTPESVLPIFIKGSIDQSLKSFFGEIGGQVDILDILKFEKSTNRFILRIFERDLVKTRTALTLISQFQGVRCHFKVNGVTPILSSLVGCHIQF